VLTLVVVLAPGLDRVRERLSGARPGWLVLALLLEFLSGVSYVLMFRPIFSRRMSWRASSEIAWSELAVSSLVPASGAGGLALGAWILRQAGMPADQIARRSVAFFLIKSSVNFIAVAVIGALIAVGLVGPHRSLWLTAVPAAASLLVIGGVLWVPRLGRGSDPAPGAGRLSKALAKSRDALIGGIAEAIEILRKRDPLVIIGAVGYWAFDNAVLWATYHSFGHVPALSIVLMGYLIGQLGGLLPIPGGIGGIDGGLIGTLIVYGAPAAGTAAAVLGYRVILFWLPLIAGAIAFALLRRDMPGPYELASCAPAIAAQSG